jgi:DNA-binding MarR family transcriptional regulator
MGENMAVGNDRVAAMTDLIFEIFRLNGRLLAAGDRLVADLGLSSARWQVLGAVAFAPSPMPVAWLARSMGLARQGVQRLVNELVDEGVLAFAPNPNHRRAKLVVLTAKGTKLYNRAAEIQAPWAKELAEGLAPKSLATTIDIARTLRRRLEVSEPVE